MHETRRYLRGDQHPAGTALQAERRLESRHADHPAGRLAARAHARARPQVGHRRHPFYRLLCSGRLRRLDLGCRPSRAIADHQRPAIWEERVGWRPLSRCAHHAGPLGHGRPGQQCLGDRRRPRRRDQPVHLPAVRQLQLRPGLVPYLLTHRHRRLGGAERPAMDGADRGWGRQDLQDRFAGDERPGALLLQRREAGHRRRLQHPAAAAIHVSKVSRGEA